MPDRPPNTVADRVRVAVKDSGKTVIDIAKRIGCSHAAIQQWMSGATQRFDAFLMFQFAAETGVELRWLLYGDGPQKAERVRPPVASRALHALAVMEKTADYRVAVALDMLDAAAGGERRAGSPRQPRRPRTQTSAAQSRLSPHRPSGHAFPARVLTIPAY